MTTQSRLRRSVRQVARRLTAWADGPESSASDAGAMPDPLHVSALYAWCRARGCAVRRQYLWSVLQASRAASSLGIQAITVIEFGVAGGNGLLQLEAAADEAERHYPVRIHVVGFDAGTGMPPPVDHRDVPWVIKPGCLAMDELALRERLRRSELIVGPVATTIPRWIENDRAPVGFVAFDLDYYSSTVDALGLFDAADDTLLPRVVCYFDDVFGYGWSDFNGERAAIADFNASHDDRKIGRIHGLRFELPADDFRRPWPEQIYLAHLLGHRRYNDFEGGVSEAFLDGHRLC